MRRPYFAEMISVRIPRVACLLPAALFAAALIGGCDSSNDAPLVEVTATYELRGASGEYEEIASLSGSAAPLDLSQAWWVPIGDARPFVRVDFDRGGGPASVPFVFAAEGCRGERAELRPRALPRAWRRRPYRRGPLHQRPRRRADCERTVAVFTIEGLGGEVGEARVYLQEEPNTPLGEPSFTTDLSRHRLRAAPATVFQSDGADWPAGRSALTQCYGTSATDVLAGGEPATKVLIVKRVRGGFWDVSVTTGCIQSFFQGVGYTAYTFPVPTNLPL